MRKSIVTAVMSLALFAAPAWVATPASAATATTATATTATATAAGSAAATAQPDLPVHPQAWQRAGSYGSEWTCLVAGAFGQVRGYWRDWDCYFSTYSGLWELYVLID